MLSEPKDVYINGKLIFVIFTIHPLMILMFFLNKTKTLNRETESNMKASNDQNILFNCDMSYDEIEAEVYQCKHNRSGGFDKMTSNL